MDIISELAKRAFAYLNSLESRLSLRWRRNNNRRTVFLLLLFASISVYTYIEYISPPDNFPINELVSVDDGQSVTQIGKSLQAQNVIRSALLPICVTD